MQVEYWEDKTIMKNNSYFESTIEFHGDTYFIAAQIIDKELFENYLFYENNEDFSLGIGIYSLLTVDSEYTKININGDTQCFKNAVLSETIHKAFSLVTLKDWRAYGVANFGLARYNHNLPLLSEDNNLLKLFIPEIEVRFSKSKILLRAISEDKLQEIDVLIRNILNDTNNTNSESSLAKRVAAQKLEVPEADTYNSHGYMELVAKAVKEINDRRYQKVILSRKIPLNQEIDMVASFIAGRRVNSPARSFILSIDGLTATGFSPETVVEVDANGWVSTLPLAGTRSCGCDGEEQKKLKEELINDTKEIAEHAVSVKLAFEEMSCACEPETIAVSDFMSIANRGTVQHIASKLRGKLKAGYNSWHAFNSLFPAVTASGIPKSESIEAIGRLEPVPRNLYSGCVMTVDSDGAMDAALVLRTIYQKDKTAWLHAGAGIVKMSKPIRELEETREKLSSFSKNLLSLKQ